MEYNRGKTPASGVRGRTTDKTRQDKPSQSDLIYIVICQKVGLFCSSLYIADNVYLRKLSTVVVKLYIPLLNNQKWRFVKKKSAARLTMHLRPGFNTRTMRSISKFDGPQLCGPFTYSDSRQQCLFGKI